MAQYLYQEYIPSLVKTSGTQIQLPSGAILGIGGQQYKTTSALSLTMTLSASTTYMIYAVVTAGVVSLVQSTNANSVGPAGYSIWKLVGAVRSDGSSQILSTGPLSTLKTITTLTSGSGTYTTPVGATLLRIKMVGGGGGGSGSGVSGWGGAGGAGTSTTFGSLTASYGSGGNASAGGSGGSASLVSGIVGVAQTGAAGNVASYGALQYFNPGAPSGGSSPLGGAGAGGVYGSSGSGTGGSAVANSGSGGGGGGAANSSTADNRSGAGGGAGGYIDAIINNPAASYTYSVGTGGTAGAISSGGSAGGAGGSGIIIIEESYA